MMLRSRSLALLLVASACGGADGSTSQSNGDPYAPGKRVDTDGDGTLDGVYVDTNQDGKSDGIDTNGDGVPDLPLTPSGDGDGHGDGDHGQGDGDTGDGDTGDGDKAPDNCDGTYVMAQPVPADVLIVQDRSSSMIGIPTGTNRWNPSISALKDVVNDLDESIRFGLLLFPSRGQSCDQGALSVDFTENAGDMVSAALDGTPPATFVDGIGQTPTDAALAHALEVIENRPMGDFETTYLADAYVLLVTDGAPGCNFGATDQNMVNNSNAIIEEMLSKDIKTYVIGYDIDSNGATIMNGFAQRGGTNEFIPVSDGAALEQALREITAANVPCKFELPGDPTPGATITVEIDGQPVDLSQESGWSIEGRVVTLNGESCTRVRDGKGHGVEVIVPCADIF